MKQLQSKLWAKITALILLTIFAVALFFSGCRRCVSHRSGRLQRTPRALCKTTSSGNAFYSDNEFRRRLLYQHTCKSKRETATQRSISYEQRFSRENSNFFFTVLDADRENRSSKAPIRMNRMAVHTQSQERYLSYNWRDIVEEDHVFASEADYYDVYRFPARRRISTSMTRTSRSTSPWTYPRLFPPMKIRT